MQEAELLLTALMSVLDKPGLRIGADIRDVATVRRALETFPAGQFLSSTFTPVELAYCGGRLERLAARWAAKEAVVKAIGVGFPNLRLSEIEVARHSTGAPYVRTLNGRSWPEDSQDWHWSVSLAHESGVAIAIAVAVLDNRG